MFSEWQLPRKVGSEKREGLRPSHRFVLFLSLPVGQLYVRDCWREHVWEQTQGGISISTALKQACGHKEAENISNKH